MPCFYTSLDAGLAMAEVTYCAGVDFACRGNCELDLERVRMVYLLQRPEHSKVTNSICQDIELPKLRACLSFRVGARTVVDDGFCTGVQRLIQETAIYDAIPKI